MRTYIKWNMGLLLLHSSKRSNTKNAFQKILVVTFVHWLEKWLCVCERALWLATLSLSQWIFYVFFCCCYSTIIFHFFVFSSSSVFFFISFLFFFFSIPLQRRERLEAMRTSEENTYRWTLEMLCRVCIKWGSHCTAVAPESRTWRWPSCDMGKCCVFVFFFFSALSPSPFPLKLIPFTPSRPVRDRHHPPLSS